MKYMVWLCYVSWVFFLFKVFISLCLVQIGYQFRVLRLRLISHAFFWPKYLCTYTFYLNVNKRLLDIFKVFAVEWHIAKYAVKVRKFRSNIEIKLIERQEWPKRNGTSDLLIIEVDETVKWKDFYRSNFSFFNLYNFPSIMPHWLLVSFT